MPLDFLPQPGIAMMQARVNRADHAVDASGPCMSLQAMVPSIAPAQLANGLLRYPLVFIYWLLLPIIRPGADVPGATPLADFVLHVARLGVAFERCILGGLDTSPCTPSVARARIKKLGLRLVASDPGPFTAVFADWYPTVPTPPAGGVAQPGAHPPEAAEALLLWLVGGDGSFEPLADAEAVILPRILPAERVAGCGFDFLFAPATAAVNATLPAALIALVPVVDRSKSAVDHFIAMATDPMLTDLENSGPARIAHMRRMTIRETLNAGNVAVALPHLNVLRLAIEPGATNNVEALRLLGEIERAVFGKVTLDLASVCATNHELQFLEPRMQQPDVQGMPSSDRVALLLGEHETAVARERASVQSGRGASAPVGGGGAGGGGGTGGSAVAGLKTGYPAAYSQELRVKLNSAAFQATNAAISRLCFGVAAGPGGIPAAVPSEHPYVIITAIFRSREVIFWHALMGYKTMLPGVPLVKHISTRIAVHGAAWLGDLACRCILPPGGAVQIPPELGPDWNSFCSGNLQLDFETLELRIRAWGVSKTATWDNVPEAQRWTSKARLTSMTRIVPPMLDEMGYPSQAGTAGTPVDLFGLAGTYADEAKALLQSSVFGNIRLTITSILQETSRRLKLDLCADDPIRSIAGTFVQSDSIHAMVLLTARANVTGQNKLQQDLAMLPGHAAQTTHISADDLTAPTRVPGASLEDEEKTARAKADADAKAAAAKAAKAGRDDAAAAKKAKVGSKAAYLVERSPDGKFTYLGPKSKGDDRMIVSRELFEAAAPAGACLPVWCASHKFPWVLCLNKDHADHKTTTGGAHAVKAGFSSVVPSLLVTAAVVANSLAVGGDLSPSPDWYVGAPTSDVVGLVRPAVGSVSPSSAPISPVLCGIADVAGLDLNQSVSTVLPPGLGLEGLRVSTPPPLLASAPAPSPPWTGEVDASPSDLVIDAEPVERAGAAGSIVVPSGGLPIEVGGVLSITDERDTAEAASRLAMVKLAAASPAPLFSVGELDSIDLWVTKNSPEPTLFFHEPSLRLIEEGLKTEEARLWEDSSSAGLVPGQVVVGISKERRVAMLVLKNARWDEGFGAAWDALRGTLVPPEWAQPESAAAADQLYQSFYKRPITGVRADGARWSLPVRILTVRVLASVHSTKIKGHGAPAAFPFVDSLLLQVAARELVLGGQGEQPGPLLRELRRALEHFVMHGASTDTEVTLSHALSRVSSFLDEPGVAVAQPLVAEGGVVAVPVESQPWTQSWVDSSGSDTGSEADGGLSASPPGEVDAEALLGAALTGVDQSPSEARARILALLRELPPSSEVAGLGVDAARAGLVHVPRPGPPVGEGTRSRPRRVLHLCSGPYDRPFGVKALLALSGIEVVEVDKERAPGVYEPAGDVERDETFEPMLQRCIEGYYGAVVMGAPCTFCSVSRVFNTHSGPPMLFSAHSPDGLRPREVPFAHRRELAQAKLVYGRLARLASAVVAQGGILFAEHPSPRSDIAFLGGRLWDHARGVTANHGSWWGMRHTKDLLTQANAYSVTLAYCSLQGAGGASRVEQKYTTLGFSPELEPFLGPLSECICSHSAGFHPRAGGREASGAWRMAKLARWPQQLIEPLVKGLASVLGGSAPPTPAVGPARRLPTHHMLGPPLVDSSIMDRGAIVLLPITFDGGVTRIGLPGGSSVAAIGRLVGADNRDSCGMQAQTWADSLFAPRGDVYAYYQATLDRDSEAPLLVVTAVVEKPPPHDLAAGRVDTARALLDHVGPGLAWASIDAVEGRLFIALGASQVGLAEMSKPTEEIRRTRVTRGGLELTPVVMRGGTVRSCATPMDWTTEVVPEALATCEALREEFRRLSAVPGTPPDIVASLSVWYDAIKMPAFEQVNPQLRKSCFRADDPRLAQIPFPSHAVPVPSDPMAPLPGPPDQRLIPPWATCLHTHALRPAYAKQMEKARVRVHERLLWSWQHNGDMTGAPDPIFFAFNSEGYQDWAAKLVRAGHVLEQGDGCILLQDHSRMPPTFWGIDYMDAFLRHSIDQGLHCATCTHGFSYLCERDPTTLVQDHLKSIYARGLDSVHKEMFRLTTLKRYGMVTFGGDFRATRLPCMYGANGTVPRASEPWRDRRICDGRSPRRVRLTWDRSARVLSIGDTCGWEESKAIHRAAGQKPSWLRHSPAFRKQPLASLMNGPIPRVVASSTTPSQARAAAVAQGLGPVEVEAAVAEHASRPRHPCELKWLFTDFMLSCCILGHAGCLLGEPLVSFEDDEADCFFQFFTALQQRHDSCIAMLDPAAVMNGEFSPDMADIEEWVTSMGIPPVSCYAQRLNTELGEEYERLCVKADEPFIAALRRSNAMFDGWCVAREQIAVHTGRVELALCKCMFYTDDPINVTVGITRAGRNVVIWDKHMGPRGCNVLMGKPLKKRMGVDSAWIGGRGLLTGLIGYIGDAKQCQSIQAIDAALAGKLDFEHYEKLAGLLNHLVCLLCMPYNVMYGIYEVHDAARAQNLSGADPAPLTANARRSLDTWRAAILDRAGTPMLAAAFDTATPPAGVAVRRMASDASRTATKGDALTDPAIVGNLYERVWIIPLGEAELELPIIVTEFLGPIFNLIIFFPYLTGETGGAAAPTALLVDSLAVPIIMTSRASNGSRMMQWLHNLLLDLPEFQALGDSLYAGHWHGPRNFFTDCGTRGRLKEMATVMRQLGMEPEWMDVPQRCLRILHEAVLMWRSLTKEERFLGEQFGSSSDGAFRYPGADGEPSFLLTPRRAAPGAAGPPGLASGLPVRVAAAPPTATPSVAAGWTDWHLVTGVARIPTEVTAATAAVLDTLSRPVPEPTMRAAPRTQVFMPTFLSQLPGPATRAERGETVVAPVLPPARATLEGMGLSPSRGGPPAAPDAGSEAHVDRVIGRGRLLDELAAFNLGSLSLTAPPCEDAATGSTGIMEALSNTSSAFSLRPLDPSMLLSMADAVADTLAHSYADSTREKDAGHMKKWANVCRYFDTPVWRTDRAANSGADPNGHVNECVLQAFALLAFYVDMQPRAHADADVGPDPQSAMNNLRGVHRAHEAKGITMASTGFASKVLKGLMRKYVKQCGIRSVRRKKPLTNAMINAMLNTPNGASLHGIALDWHSYAGAATAAWVSTLAEDGDRKDEIAKRTKDTPFELGRLSFASLVFKIAACGGEVAFPTLAQLHLMDEAAGDGVFLKHGRAKNDFFGVFFASTPSFLPFLGHSPRNAARSLRRLYAMALKRGLTAALAPTTPLFGANFGEEFTHWEVETYFEIMMRFGANVSVDELKDYSIHSFRIWVACALMAANVPRHTIKRLLRWRGDLSLEIYARLNDSEWSQHVRGTYTAHVDSTIAARLASLGSLDLEQAALRLGADAD